MAIGAYLVSLVAAMWEITPTRVIEDNRWEILVFKTVFYSCSILSPCAAHSVLLLKQFPWYHLAVISSICLIITLFNFYDMLKSSLTLVWENVVVVATRWNMSPDDQVLPITDAATARIAAEEEDQNNLGGSGSSPNIPCLSTTGPAPNLNGFTNVPL